jgi:hypothetical protein
MQHLFSSRRFGVLVCCLALFALACDETSVQPPPVAHVTLELVIEPTVGAAVPGYVITTTVTNDGDLSVLAFSSGCEGFTVLRGPDAEPVETHLPYACPTDATLRSLAPGAILRESNPFTGVVYRSGVPEDALPGTYEVKASFMWAASEYGAPHREERQQTFDWNVP